MVKLSELSVLLRRNSLGYVMGEGKKVGGRGAHGSALPRPPEFAIWEARVSAFTMRKNNDKRLPWYDSPAG